MLTPVSDQRPFLLFLTLALSSTQPVAATLTAAPAVLQAKPAAVVVSMERVRVIATADACFFPPPRCGADKAVVSALVARLRSEPASDAAPLELVAVDVGLDTCLSRLDAVVTGLEDAACGELARLAARGARGASFEATERVRSLKAEVSAAAERGAALRTVLLSTLDDDDAMRRLHVTAGGYAAIRRSYTEAINSEDDDDLQAFEDSACLTLLSSSRD